ncbi:hypothetical protein [Bradyrhizobium sp. S69]|uniref:hypothetical protein n=1 Tax=Bradyrhizobium sp. S69 TaxID=1641856 RepID=UPI00131CD18D|nr:hypothetical protein [Bradyrhizobium sp. S69]
MAFFKSKKIQGTVYDLPHLEPFKFNVAADDEEYRVLVEFGCHCFTTKLEQHHTPDLVYEHKLEKRAFDIERYELSKLLPDYIRGLVGSSVYWSNKGSFFFWRTPEDDLYLIFFTALKAKTGNVNVRIKIESAYPAQKMTKYASPIEFADLIKTKAEGGFPDFGPTVELKRK